MKWNWQQSDWPEFSWKQALLLKAEALLQGKYCGLQSVSREDTLYR